MNIEARRLLLLAAIDGVGSLVVNVGQLGSLHRVVEITVSQLILSGTVVLLKVGRTVDLGVEFNSSGAITVIFLIEMHIVEA